MPSPFTLSPLPWPDHALSPVIQPETIHLHYGKHHAGYVDKLNTLLEKKPDLRAMHSLKEVICASAGEPGLAEIFNNAAQVWNHDFYWRSLAPKAGGKPTGKIAPMIDKAFGDYESFKKKFSEIAMGQFGSGWAWLCLEDGKLTLRKTGNAETPLVLEKVTPLMTLDVWEHAYYLDYRNRRAEYIAAVLESLWNWDYAEENLAAAS